MMLSRSMTFLLFLSLPLMVLARRFPDGGAVDRVTTTRQVLLKISAVLLRDDCLSEGKARSSIRLGHDYEAITSITNSGDARRQQLEGIPRFGGGVGSRPPKCTDRCGMCSPCIPMNVPVGDTRPDDEYYPEVWRCQCDGRLYIP